jgi:hypothetical protein
MWTVAYLVRRLSDERQKLDELQAGDLAVSATFELSYAHLEPDHARAFRLLALPDSADFSVDMAAAVLDTNPDRAGRIIESLADMNLIQSMAPKRYRYHDLLRLHARDCADRHDKWESRTSVLVRLMDFYIASAASVYELEMPGDCVTSVSHPVLGCPSPHVTTLWNGSSVKRPVSSWSPAKPRFTGPALR